MGTLSSFYYSLRVGMPAKGSSLSVARGCPGNRGVVDPKAIVISTNNRISSIGGIISPMLMGSRGDAVCRVSFDFSGLHLKNSTFTRSLGGMNSSMPAMRGPRCFHSTFLTMRRLMGGNLVVTNRSVSTNNLVAALLRVYFSGVRNNVRVDLGGVGRSSVVGVLFTRGPNVIVRMGSGRGRRIGGVLRSTNVNCMGLNGPARRQRVLMRGKSTACRFNVSCLHSM